MICHRRRRAPHRHQGWAAAGALPGQWRRVGRGVVEFAIWRPKNRVAAEAKIGARRISGRPLTSIRSEAENFGSGGQTWVGGGGCLGVRHDDLFRRRRDDEGSRGKFAAAVYFDGGLLDLVNRQRPRSHEARQNGDAARDVTTAILPAPDAPRTDAEQPGDAMLCNAKGAKGRTEFGRSY